MKERVDCVRKISYYTKIIRYSRLIKHYVKLYLIFLCLSKKKKLQTDRSTNADGTEKASGETPGFIPSLVYVGVN